MSTLATHEETVTFTVKTVRKEREPNAGFVNPGYQRQWEWDWDVSVRGHGIALEFRVVQTQTIQRVLAVALERASTALIAEYSTMVGL